MTEEACQKPTGSQLNLKHRHPAAEMRRRCSGLINRIDPGSRQRIKGLRLVAGYGLASMLASLAPMAGRPPGHALPLLAGAFALWAAVSEARTTRLSSGRDLVLLVGAAVSGAGSYAIASEPLSYFGPDGPELMMITGAFLVGALRRFGPLGAGLGSQVFIGQLLACAAGMTLPDLPGIGLAGFLACIGSVIPCLLAGSPAGSATPASIGGQAAWIMGLQAATAVLAIVLLNAAIGLPEPWWAMAGCTYVVAGTAQGTMDRARRRALGTIVAVPLGLAYAPYAAAHPTLSWAAAAVAMVAYAIALPRRYDIACGAYSFALVVTMAGTGTSEAILAARLWDTLLGSVVGLASATILFPLRPPAELGVMDLGTG